METMSMTSYEIIFDNATKTPPPVEQLTIEKFQSNLTTLYEQGINSKSVTSHQVICR